MNRSTVTSNFLKQAFWKSCVQWLLVLLELESPLEMTWSYPLFGPFCALFFWRDSETILFSLGKFFSASSSFHFSLVLLWEDQWLGDVWFLQLVDLALSALLVTRSLSSFSSSLLFSYILTIILTPFWGFRFFCFSFHDINKTSTMSNGLRPIKHQAVPVHIPKHNLTFQSKLHRRICVYKPRGKWVSKKIRQK